MFDILVKSHNTQWLNKNHQMQSAQSLRNEVYFLYTSVMTDAAQYSSSWAVGAYF